MNALYTLSAAAVLATLLPSTQAHMSMWHPSMYGFDQSYEPVTPLANKPFNQWWFHGYANNRPNQVMSITPGQNLNIEIACSKSYSTYGNSPNPDGCPGDSGSFHAGGSTGSGSGWWGNSESNLMGCALAIAPKSRASDVRPEDFTVMSIQENCVRQRDTSFAIPQNLPSCPDGECTCAWFWQGKNSAEEMYMIGFRCRVENGAAVPFPSPAKPKRGAISGATQPLYWANDNSNLDYKPGWNDRPSYNAAFGWKNGAQTSAFGASNGGNGNNGGGNNNNNGNTRSSASASSTGWQGNNDNNWAASSSSSSRRSRPTQGDWNNNNGEWNNNSASATSTAGESQPTQWNQHLAQPEAESSASSTASSAAATASPAAVSPASKPSPKPKVCHRGHVKRRSRNHI